MSQRVCVIGIDCAPPELVFGEFRSVMPNVDRLIRSGIHGPLQSTIPPITVPAWMCMMTGKDPGTLGIYGFRNRKDHSYDALEFANSRMVREEAVWDILGRQGKRSTLIGVPLTYPPKPINGLLVGDFLTPSTDADYTFPSDLKDEIRSVVGDYVVDVRNFRTTERDRVLADLRHMAEQRFRLARHLATSHPWDFLMLVEMGTDRLHHAFWRFHDPRHPQHEPQSRYRNTIRDYYIELDGYIGDFLDALPDDTTVMLVSDHGAGPMDGGICLNEWLMQEGYLALKQPVTAMTKFSTSLVDWSRTRAWGDGGYYGRLFINVEGREPQGTVPADQADALLAELTARLEALGDEQGNPIGTRVMRPRDVYRAVNGVAPDLIVYFGNLRWRSVGSLGHGTVWTHENDIGPDDANHSETGIAVIARLDAPPRNSEPRPMSIYDIAPTILSEFGVQPPAGMVGSSVVSSQEAAPVYTPEEEAEIARRLEDLGYL
jgi:predicted AlkP superfamily phosphohydrolase/phosphomutase